MGYKIGRIELMNFVTLVCDACITWHTRFTKILKLVRVLNDR